VAVLGAGTMGAQIAVLAAGTGASVRLLDVTRDAAAAGLARAKRLTPDPAFAAEDWARVTPGSFAEDMAAAGDCDWIVEAVVEDASVKQGLFAALDAVRRADAIVSTNTSALSIGALGEGRSEGFQRHWCGTHFFNPPRYLPLVGLVPGRRTERGVLDRLTAFLDRRLGKSVVVARDTPGFIGNHLALYATGLVLADVEAGRVSIDEADVLTGMLIGRPKSATFRTLDLAGLDIVRHVMQDLATRVPDVDARTVLTPSAALTRLTAAGALGEKAGHGFYRRARTTDGQSIIETVDLHTLAYRAPAPVHIEGLDAIRDIADTDERLRALFADPGRAGAFTRATLAPLLVYAARVAPAVAGSIDDVDRVMRWGFGWQHGPFEAIDAVGARTVWAAATASDPALLSAGPPPLLAPCLDAPSRPFRSGHLPPAASDLLLLRTSRDRRGVLTATPGASLVDLGDGVLAVEFHSKMNTLGADAIAMLERGVDEAEARFSALVVGNEGPHFSAGADLALVLAAADREDWNEVDRMVRALQHATTRLRGAAVPVVVAPFNLTLGGGTEIALHAHRTQAAGESYLGLVETGVGLIPAGGGTKEMLARAIDSARGDDVMAHLQRAFETIAFGLVSTSAWDARRLGLLSAASGITMNRERLISEAKATALDAARDYQAPAPRLTIPVGGDATYAPLALGVHLAWRAGRISEHDAYIGRTLAEVMAGGRVPHPTTVSEAHLLDLEREAFLRLTGTPATRARIRHTLSTGKPLRN